MFSGPQKIFLWLQPLESLYAFTWGKENSLLHLPGKQNNAKVKDTNSGVRLCPYWLGDFRHQLHILSMVDKYRASLVGWLDIKWDLACGAHSKRSVDVSNNYRDAKQHCWAFSVGETSPVISVPSSSLFLPNAIYSSQSLSSFLFNLVVIASQ